MYRWLVSVDISYMKVNQDDYDKCYIMLERLK